MDDYDLRGAQQLLGDDQGAQGAEVRPAAGVADDVGVTLRQPEAFGRVQARIHAAQDGDLAAGRHREVSPIERRCVAGVGLRELVGGYHAVASFSSLPIVKV